jgi:hypothetical protein
MKRLILSDYVQKEAEKRYLSIDEVYQEQILVAKQVAFKHNFEHEDAVQLAYIYCTDNAARLIKQGSNYLEQIIMYFGPATITLEKLMFEVQLGENYELELVFSEIAPNTRIKINGIMDLKPFIENTEDNTLLKVDNVCEVSLNDLKIEKYGVLSLSISGAIRVTSRIDYILKVEG